MRPRLWVVAVLVLAFPSIIYAQETPHVSSVDIQPDPATVDTPVVNSDDPKVIDQGYKFFYFYSPDVDFPKAVSDVAECRSFLRHGVFLPQSHFIPWVEPAHRKIPKADYFSPYGPLGSLMAAAIAGIIMPKINRGLDNNMVRRCMEPRGYKRYPIPEDSWKAINQGKDERQNILAQAKLASGVRPQLPEVTEK